MTTQSALPEIFVEHADTVARANYIDSKCLSVELKNPKLLVSSFLLVCLTTKKSRGICAAKQFLEQHTERYMHYAGAYKDKTKAEICRMAKEDKDMKKMFQKASKKKR
ncbi:hypothetical protein [Pseudovibrio sp. Tun.PSC04-5.I4]|uniref:hypothetical protein n=1 Tax=Pseudovibrio sp. Tun.PSC04-5.I4 TaxID=1798213 RepID=UPI00117BC8C4|nr:hypothetical protein [Pseudovibrio sp. Tun.PSC04-5.I4]